MYLLDSVCEVYVFSLLQIWGFEELASDFGTSREFWPSCFILFVLKRSGGSMVSREDMGENTGLILSRSSLLLTELRPSPPPRELSNPSLTLSASNISLEPATDGSGTSLLFFLEKLEARSRPEAIGAAKL